MGAQKLRERSRRGPFRASSGSSRIMDSSAHVSYRRRGHALEITVRRGVTGEEIDVLIGKLSMHRLSSQRSELFLITNKRHKLGNLDRTNMDKLRAKIEKELEKRRVIGLLVHDVYGKGLLHKGLSHSLTSRESHRRLIEIS